MTRDEISRLLETLFAAYPNTKMKDPAKTLDVWEMDLAEYNAEDIYKAARLYIAEGNTFFPVPGALTKIIPKAQLIYNAPPKVTVIPSSLPDSKTTEYIESFCEWIGFGSEPNDEALDEYYEKHPEMLEPIRRALGNED